MKTSQPRWAKSSTPDSETVKIVKHEVAVIKRASKKASESREAAIAFLKGAGIVTDKGNHNKKYR